MKTFLLFALLLVTFTTKATNYYFSNISGDDSRSAVQAKSPLTPWKSLAKLNSIFSNLLPGDSVLLKRQETFYGSITISKSGTAQAPIVIGAYGTGANPVVTSLVTLSWVSAGNNLWRSNERLGLSSLNMVTVNGSPAGMGRWPNLDNGNGGYDSVRAATYNSLTDLIGLIKHPSPGKPTYFVGAEVVVRTKRWLIDRHLITGYNASNGIIKFDPSSTNEVVGPNFGYFIQDDSTVLDRAGEWWYNRTNKKIKMFSSGTPANVSAANLQNLLVSSNKSYIAVSDVTFNGCNADAIIIEAGSHVTVKNCNIVNVGRNAVNTSSAYGNFLNNTMTNLMSKGILINQGAHHTIIRYNTIRNVSQIRGLGTSQQEDNRSCFSGDGIYIKDAAITVEYNNFIKMGYSAVHLTKVDYVVIRYNFIDTVCNVYDDGGAIYTYTGSAYTNHGRVISNNIILHGIGAVHGSGVKGGSAAGAGVAGIYNDRGTSDVTEEGNTVAYFEKGIFENYGCTRNIIRNNTFYHNVSGIQINTRLKDKTRNLRITGNISIAAANTQKAMNIYSDDGDVLNQFGKVDSNFYARPINDVVTMTWQSNQGNNNIHTGTLSDWKAKFPVYDAKSKKGPQDITSASQIRFELNPTTTAKTISFSGNYIDARGIIHSNSITLQPFASAILIKTDDAQNDAPEVVITSPATNASFNAPASINITASASDADGSVTKVDFYNGNTLIHTETAAPYAFTMNNVAAGTYVLTAKAEDNDGLVTSSAAVTLKVLTPNAAPEVAITSPATNTSFNAPASINITASASDADGSVTKVDFYNGNTLIHTETAAPYAFTLNNVAAGTYVLTAKATDNDGLVTSSAAVTLKVLTPNAAPEVAITSPATNTSFNAPASINITASASDADGSVTKVDFYNGNTLIHTETAAPYAFTMNNVAAGNYVLTAKATDNDGLVTSSAAITITVITPNYAPAVSITSPAANAGFNAPASITITAAASDADGTITSVEFYNGTTLLTIERKLPYSWSWNNVPAGNYTLTAKATDNNGKITVSGAVAISVLAPNKAPAVQLNNLQNGAIFYAAEDVVFTASANDTDGTIAKVDFYAGSTLIHSETTSPYTFSKKLAAGNSELTAIATDNKGATTQSQGVSIVVAQNGKPGVAISYPLNNAIYKADSTISMSANATAGTGSITKVEFYNGTTLLKTENTAPYLHKFKNVPAGNYSLTAKVYNSNGVVATSTIIKVTVTANANTSTPAARGTSVSVAPKAVSVVTVAQKSNYEDHLTAVDIKLAPNPASSMLSVSTNGLMFNQEVEVSILSMSGAILKTIASTSSSKVIQVNVSSLRAGVYILRLTTKNSVIAKQFEKL